MKSFKIAVCLSGQARHWKIAAENIKMFFNYSDTHHFHYNVPIETDYFIHTWDTNTWRYPKTHHATYENVKHNDKKDIEDTFNPKFIEQEEFNQDKFESAWDPMFYSFGKSVMFKRIYELENNITYDVVVKARLDTIYNPQQKIKFQEINPSIDGLMPGICYTSLPVNKFIYEFNCDGFDDVIFYADSRTMDIVSDLYDTYKIKHSPQKRFEFNKSINTDASLYYGPGCLLYDHMINSGIYPTHREKFEYVVVRSTSAVDNLNSIIYYDEIKKRGFEWYSM
jgi:hypothetical protein